MSLPRENELTQCQKAFLLSAIEQVEKDERLIGLAVGGSIAKGTIDEFSDLDLIIVVKPEDYEQVMADRKGIAIRFGQLLAGFTGEHVGDDRLLICLFGPSLIHVDLKFISLADVHMEASRPVILLDKAGGFSRELKNIVEHFPKIDIQWLEDRFWVWIHYAAIRIARGEFFETIDFLAFLRRTVLVPLAFDELNELGYGVRKAEQRVPEFSAALKKTVGCYHAGSLVTAVHESIALYLEQRKRFENELLNLREDARIAAIGYLDCIEKKYCSEDCDRRDHDI
ncbi:MAG: hypothetical protein A2W80_08420 [Candidatus Riflebacteria bacterium GWC2_50_8]|nr:MAG: hypothetical protein A2W80_08420 [Candidatus Riflebacteria bacterium GWC2_50_8]